MFILLYRHWYYNDYLYKLLLLVFMSAYNNHYTVLLNHYNSLNVCLLCVLMHYRLVQYNDYLCKVL